MSGARDAIAIFDAIAEMGRRDAIAFKVKELRASIAHSQTRCGGCVHWMIPSCPRETLLPNGRKKGPHMNEYKCDKFVMKDGDARMVADWQDKIDRLLRAPSSSGEEQGA